MATPTTTGGPSTTSTTSTATPSKPPHRYTTEIAQMCFVFHGEVKDVGAGGEDHVVQYLEEVVRAQLGDLVQQARTQAARRGARHLSVEDLIFLLRHDREKLHRVRTYLSWKDVRKKVKDSEGADEELDNMEEADRTLKAHKMHIQIPWDLASMYGDCLSEETDGAEDEEVEAYEDSKKRLKEADDLTRNMTKEEYLHYADCAQASFVYRKSKKFRDFLSLGNSIDGVAFNDEVMDVLGFLAYEMVRKLCEAGVETKKRLAVGRARAAVRDVREGKEREEKEQEKKLKRARRGDGAAEGVGEGKGEEDEAATMDVDKPIGSTTPASVDTPSTKKARKTPTSTTGGAPNDTSAPSPRSPPRPLLPPTSLFSEPLPVPTANTAPTSTSTPAPESLVQNLVGEVLGAQEKGAPLLLHEVSAGFVSLQQGKASLKASGMRNWRGGVSRLGNRFV